MAGTGLTNEQIFDTFKEQAVEPFKYGIRLNSVSGRLPCGLEALISSEFAQVSYNFPDNDTIQFNLSNGSTITI
jgi:hypothetical protein